MLACCTGATSWALLYPLETIRSRITAGKVPFGQVSLHGLAWACGWGRVARGLEGWVAYACGRGCVQGIRAIQQGIACGLQLSIRF